MQSDAVCLECTLEERDATGSFFNSFCFEQPSRNFFFPVQIREITKCLQEKLHTWLTELLAIRASTPTFAASLVVAESTSAPQASALTYPSAAASS